MHIIDLSAVLIEVLLDIISCFSIPLIRLIINMAQQDQHRFLNRLANEKSSYLQQHAHNPVNW